MSWHLKASRSYEIEANTVEAQNRDKAVNRAPVLQVPKKGDGATIDGAELRTDGVNVQQGLIEMSFVNSPFKL